MVWPCGEDRKKNYMKIWTMEMESARPRGRPRKTWLDVLYKNDMKQVQMLGGGRLWGIYVPTCYTQVCLDLPWDSQDELAVK